MRIDSHQHFWRYSPTEYPWMKADWPIRRDFLPSDLASELKRHDLDGCIAVQARQTLEETRWLLQLAAEHPIIQGVVGWVDLRATNVAEQLRQFAANPKLVGVRHVVQDEPDDNFMLQPEFIRGVTALKSFDLVYDLLIFPRQLPAAIELVDRFPEQTFVLDHIAKPAIREKTLEPWAELIAELAQFPNVVCKVSGMVTEADWKGWQPADVEPYLRHILKSFGGDRLMFGSDWPVCLLAGSYERVFGLAKTFAAQLSSDQQEQFFGGTAARTYRVRS